MKSLTVLLCSLAATALTQTTRPFQIIIATPNLPTFVPMYLTSSGGTTSVPSEAAAAHLSNGELYISPSTIPVGAGTGAWETMLLPLQGKDSINTLWSIDDENHLQWVNGRFPFGMAEFVFATGGETPEGGAVYAQLGPVPEGEGDQERFTTEANLLVHVPDNW